MVDIYATPESDVVQSLRSMRAGGNIEDAMDAKVEVAVLAILREACCGLKGFKLTCHITAMFWPVAWMTLDYTMLYFKLFGAESQTLVD